MNFLFDRRHISKSLCLFLLYILVAMDTAKIIPTYNYTYLLTYLYLYTYRPYLPTSVLTIPTHQPSTPTNPPTLSVQSSTLFPISGLDVMSLLIDCININTNSSFHRNPHPPIPPHKAQFLGHFVAKKGPFGPNPLIKPHF